MFKNKTSDGKNNVSGARIAAARKAKGFSQKVLSDLLLDENIDLNKNAVQRMESGERFITDIELAVLAKVLDLELKDLIDETLLPKA